MTETAQNLLVEKRGPVTIISINRPHRRNAVDAATANALFAALTAFDGDESAAVAVLTGTQGTFCAGADLIAAGEGDRDDMRTTGGTGTLAPMGPSRMRLSKPTIAAIEGHAVAGGTELALWADLRVVAEDATFGIFCRRFGVPLIDLGTIRLPRLIGHSRAMDLILTGRPVGASEALQIGLANRVVPSGRALEHAIEMADQLASFPQTCLRSDRHSALSQWDLSEDDAMRVETQGGAAVIGSGETAAGFARFTGGVGRHGKFD